MSGNFVILVLCDNEMFLLVKKNNIYRERKKFLENIC